MATDPISPLKKQLIWNRTKSRIISKVLPIGEDGKRSLLTYQQEAVLGKHFQRTKDLIITKKQLEHQLNKAVPLQELAEKVGSSKQELILELRKGIIAKELFIEGNRRLVGHLAKKFLDRGLPLDDLVQEGTLGLLNGTYKFDSTKGYRFITYIQYWILQVIRKAIKDQSRTIRLPVHIHDKLAKMYKESKNFTQENGRKPTREELAARAEITVDNLEELLCYSRKSLSLDVPIGEKGDHTLADLVESKDQGISPSIDYQLLKNSLSRLPVSLNPLQRRVIILRFGLETGIEMTFEEISQKMNIEVDKVKNLKEEALRVLKRKANKNFLKDFE